MKQTIQIFLASVLSIFTTVITAHPGHEHGTWEGMIMHIIFYAVIVIGLVGVAKYIYRRKQL